MRTATLKLTVLSVLALALSGASAFAESPTKYMDDTAITAKIKKDLMAAPHLKSMEISVTTDQGDVQLSGTVDTKAQELEAVRLARAESGVKSVTDNLNVRSAGKNMTAPDNTQPGSPQ